MFPAVTRSRWPALTRFPDVRVMSMFASLFGWFAGARNLLNDPFATVRDSSRWAKLISAFGALPLPKEGQVSEGISLLVQ